MVVLVAGFASEANIALLKELGYAYLINITRGSRTKYAAEDFMPIPGRPAEQQVEVKTIINPDDPEQQLILCRSQQRRLKEVAMVSSSSYRLLQRLDTTCSDELETPPKPSRRHAVYTHT